MSDSRIEQIRQKLLAACEAARQSGHEIITKQFGVTRGGGIVVARSSSSRCCPLGAFILGKKLESPNGIDWVYPTIQTHLGITEDEMDSFWSTFDGNTHLVGKASDFHALGREFRALYIEKESK